MKKNIILTNMVMLYDDEGNILVLNREKNDWPGLTFPGGHTENDETIIESAIREFKEETGLDIFNLENCGYYEWNNIDENRHLSILFKTKDYAGKIKNSFEGKVFFINEKDMDKYQLSNDFKEIYSVMKNNN